MSNVKPHIVRMRNDHSHDKNLGWAMWHSKSPYDMGDINPVWCETLAGLREYYFVIMPKKMKTQIFKSYEDFLQREDKLINGVSERFAEKHPNWQEMNSSNKGCWNCVNCTNCTNCTDCTSCDNCTNCYDCTNCHGCTDCSDCSRCFGCTDCTGRSYEVGLSSVKNIKG